MRLHKYFFINISHYSLRHDYAWHLKRACLFTLIKKMMKIADHVTQLICTYLLCRYFTRDSSIIYII